MALASGTGAPQLDDPGFQFGFFGRQEASDTGDHTVEQRRNPATGDLVFTNARRFRHEADSCIEQNGCAEEHVTENLVRHAHLIEHTDNNDKRN